MVLGWLFGDDKKKEQEAAEERRRQQLLEAARSQRLENEARAKKAEEEFEAERTKAEKKEKKLRAEIAAREREKELRDEIRKSERELMFTIVDVQNKMHDLTLKNLQEREEARSRQMAEQLTFQNKQMEMMRADYMKSRESFFEHIKQKPQNDIITSQDMEEIVQKAKRDLNLDTIKCYNFGFVGHVKTGKSSMINAVRGITNKAPNAAKVDDVECTKKIEPYTYANPELSHVRFYDIPGAGTLTHDSDSYYNDKCLCAFDCLIIVTQDALGQDEINFALQALKFKQPIAFVRSKMDVALNNALLAEDIEEKDQATANIYIKNMNNAFIKEIERVQKPELTKVPCFFISSHVLRKIMNNTLPDSEVAYQEHFFLEYIKSRSIFSRNTVSVNADEDFTTLG